MNIMVGVASRQGPQQNPLMHRLLDSLKKYRPGANMAVQIEVGEQYTRGEKRQRIFTLAKAHGIRYCVILEDDTEILEDDWLARLIQPMVFGDILGMVNPMESKDGLTPCAPQLKGQIIETVQCYGFAILYDLSWDPRYDPRITWLDDLAMSLQCRATGRRVVTAGVTMVRHSKEPFLRDDQPPWAQQDRSRWGETSSYYSQDAFDGERRAEAALLVQQYGEMARMSLPRELLVNEALRSERADARTLELLKNGGKKAPLAPQRSEVDRLIEEYQGVSDPG